MTSLMDVMFLVLVFFIYCIFDMAVHRGMKVELPDSKGEPEKGERIVMTITADDKLEFNGLSVTQEEAVGRIRELQRVGMNLPVLISGDKNSSLGVGISLLSELKQAGVASAVFQVKK
jgi:biopolymer transport protein ExbD